MDFQDLLKRFQDNVARTSRARKLEIPGVGLMYVRRRTVLEYEQMNDLRRKLREGKADTAGVLGISLARLLCDENGNRFGDDEEIELGKVIARCPEEVMNMILAVADGQDEPEEAVEEPKEEPVAEGPPPGK